MEPICYTVTTINGDYAYMISDTGVEHKGAMFLVSETTDPGRRPLLVHFYWKLVS